MFGDRQSDAGAVQAGLLRKDNTGYQWVNRMLGKACSAI